ncbi:MAG TPA: acyltransferase [Thermodesulfobacteriota bacterium]|nr:acyltransferase [Thermodesulfobacteriota bacterium]
MLTWVFGRILMVVSFCSKSSMRMKISLYKRLGAKIGRDVRLYGRIDGVNPHLVAIGDYSVIGKGSILVAHCPVRGPRPVSIGSFVWMGFGGVVLPGVTVGDHTIIGAGSVVTKDIPSFSIAAGNPARILRKRDPEEIDRTAQLLREGKPIGSDSGLGK